jgi:hypothetical protein
MESEVMFENLINRLILPKLCSYGTLIRAER